MSKKIVFFVLLILIILLFSIIFIKTATSNINVKIQNDNLSINLLNVSRINLESEKTSDFFGQEDITYKYSLFKNFRKIGYIELTKRAIDNGDYFVFVKSINLKKHFGYAININLNNVYAFNIIDNQVEKKEYSAIVGYDKTTTPYSYFSSDKNGSIILSKLYKSRILEQKYDEEQSSFVRELISENSEWKKTGETNYKILIDGESEIQEFWFLFSNENLIESELEKQEYINMYMKSAGSTPWITKNGQYDKIAYSINPFTREGYARNPGNSFGENEYKYYSQTKKRIYYDLLINKLIGLYNIPRNEQGVWYTEYTSTYVSDDTNIFAPFVDTRHNENISKYLSKVSKELNINQLEDDSLCYPNYIVSKIENGLTLKLNNGLFLISDYYSDFNNNISHASLNHQLGTANLLLLAYSKSGNQKQFDAGISIINAIESLDNLWIRDNGDLWYRINADFTFEGNDYAIVTLDDLLLIQNTLESINQKRSTIFDKFILSKYQYLLSINYNIPKGTREMIINQNIMK